MENIHCVENTALSSRKFLHIFHTISTFLWKRYGICVESAVFSIMESAAFSICGHSPIPVSSFQLETFSGRNCSFLLIPSTFNLRYFDKSFNLCIGKNGKAGLHCEHTWGDGSIVSNFFQECLFDDYKWYAIISIKLVYYFFFILAMI